MRDLIDRGGVTSKPPYEERDFPDNRLKVEDAAYEVYVTGQAVFVEVSKLMTKFFGHDTSVEKEEVKTPIGEYLNTVATCEQCIKQNHQILSLLRAFREQL